jgi:hypothetical protein
MPSAKFLTRVAFMGLEPKASSDEAIGGSVSKNGTDGCRLWIYFTVIVSNCAPETT